MAEHHISVIREKARELRKITSNLDNGTTLAIDALSESPTSTEDIWSVLVDLQDARDEVDAFIGKLETAGIR
jgi:hypothetical protein